MSIESNAGTVEAVDRPDKQGDYDMTTITSTYDEWRIEGTIERGRLEIRVYAPGFTEAGSVRLRERVSMTKAP